MAAVQRTEPLPITQGEPFEHLIIIRFKDTEDSYEPWPDTIGSSLTRGSTTVDFGTTEDDDAGTILLTLTGDDTAAMAAGLWAGGLELDGRTWCRFYGIVEKDPTP